MVASKKFPKFTVFFAIVIANKEIYKDILCRHGEEG
jgi:hypothetical protein